MKAVISTTYSDTYLFMLPIVTWAWNKLGVDVICFHPANIIRDIERRKLQLIINTRNENGLLVKLYGYGCESYKEATYAQCLRNYAACLDLDKNEFLVTSDIDMLLFKRPLEDIGNDKFQILGTDLVPSGQYPVCYCGAKVKTWRYVFDLNGKTYQQAIDELLGNDECQDYRACRWSVDQEQLYLKISQHPKIEIKRAREGTQFASNRIDRDDAYFMDRLTPDIIDYHCHRPAFQDDNFEKMLAVISYFYPNENLEWMKIYHEQYKQLMK